VIDNSAHCICRANCDDNDDDDNYGVDRYDNGDYDNSHSDNNNDDDNKNDYNDDIDEDDDDNNNVDDNDDDDDDDDEENVGPVCGTDGMTYSSSCRLRLIACRQQSHVQVAYYERCTGLASILLEVPLLAGCN